MADVVNVTVARNEVFIPKTTIGPEVLRGETVSSATGTIGTDPDPTANTALGTALSVVSPAVYATVLTTEWPVTGAIAYLGILITMSGGRKIARRYDCKILW